MQSMARRDARAEPGRGEWEEELMLEGSPFRPDAYARYVSQRKHATLPRLVRPATFRILWALALIVLAAGAVAWCTEVPIFASGTAVALAEPDRAVGEGALLVLMPPECCGRWRSGEKLAVRLPGTQDWLEAVLRAPEDAPAGPVAIEERYRLHGAAAASLDRPRAIAIATLSSRASVSTTRLEAGTILEARVEIGRRRALSLLPGLGGANEGSP